MKTRDSGMPDEDWWTTFFDPPVILQTLGFDQIHGPVVDVGCGYGTFTLALARMTRHPVIALDIETDMVVLTRGKAAQAGFAHVDARLVDVTDGSLGVTPSSVDVVLLFNILHCEAPLELLNAARTALRPDGRVGVIHWRSDVPTPRGPDIAIRPKPDQCRSWLVQTGFQIEREAATLHPYHFGMVGRNPLSEALATPRPSSTCTPPPKSPPLP
ncbi:MAG: class I SAM-dependent methyltransferase [Planctomycetota bacterium]